MDDLISRQAAIEAVLLTDREDYAVDALKNLPSVTPKRKTGMWEHKIDGVYCSECYLGWDYITGVPANIDGYNFCPNCGAEMREDGEP